MVPKVLKFSTRPFRRKKRDDIPLKGESFNSPLNTDWSVMDEQDAPDDRTSSSDSMETIDDNPGTGRTLDKYFYKPVGLRIERGLNKVFGPMFHKSSRTNQNPPETPVLALTTARYDYRDDSEYEVSISSSLETIDDNPGAGRTVDKYFYQPAGLSIERFLNRTLGTLLTDPVELGEQIMLWIEPSHQSGLFYSLQSDHSQIRAALERVCDTRTFSGLERLISIAR